VGQGAVRYNEDSSGTGLTWAQLIAAHGDEPVTYVQIQAGNAGSFSNGSTSHVRNVTLEATGVNAAFSSYTFGL